MRRTLTAEFAMTQPTAEPGLLPRALEAGYGAVFRVIAKLGLPPSFVVLLETRGRRTGTVRATVLLTATHDGQVYLVSVLGDDTDWVRNVRANGGEATLRHGKRLPVRLDEVPPAERAPVLKAYLKWAFGARRIFEVSHKAPVDDFERIAGRHPVFRIVARDAR